ncbi:5-formyltetrahydrofolate cyclo-ligase [Condylostylus longicornis]|uniref:5-formyltetrahydrofolate cyclo-ligase n=1 Tax=Condylostylus longicornis TaxID=2530218 RepID=UPI00244E2B29|nr:5-formyltetrahydrofolate cyclo-ligase [Condylostylus longicornis]
MTSSIGNPLKKAMRKAVSKKTSQLSLEAIKKQSEEIRNKIISSELFKKSERICVYLSTPTEVDTIGILEEMFKFGKKVFVPAYHGKSMEMLLIKDMNDYESLSITKWNIKQPNYKDNRENALATGLDLFLMPGVGFSIEGGRLGHGMGYYDKYLKRYFEKYPENLLMKNLKDLNSKNLELNNKTILIGLAFKEQILEENEIPLEEHDFRLNYICTV